MNKKLYNDDRSYLLVIDARGDATDLLRIVECLRAWPRAGASPGPVDDRARQALEGLAPQARQVLEGLEEPGDPVTPASIGQSVTCGPWSPRSSCWGCT